MAKISSNYTIDEDIYLQVVEMAKTELNGTKISVSLMVQVLLKEALLARQKKRSKKAQ